MDGEGEGGVKPERLKLLESKPLEEEALGRLPSVPEMALMWMMSSMCEKSVSILRRGSSLSLGGRGGGLLKRDPFLDLSLSFFGGRGGVSGVGSRCNWDM